MPTLSKAEREEFLKDLEVCAAAQDSEVRVLKALRKKLPARYVAERAALRESIGCCERAARNLHTIIGFFQAEYEAEKRAAHAAT